MDGQLSLFAPPPQDDRETLFTPNGHQRCEHCRKRLHAFGGRLLCANPHCTGVTR